MPEPLNLRPAIAEFAAELEILARRHEAKPDWATLPLEEVWHLFKVEAIELGVELDAHETPSPYRVQAESLDVALCALMLWDKCAKQPSTDRGRQMAAFEPGF